ncbi:hypothetical protein LXL04_000286 [Taraxacum kok-saghyz]
MVEYFGEQLSGFAFTANGWVQSYGSRCVKPPIIYGDVSRPKSMTVFWSSMAQEMTKRPMKGMLTGPVTILNWSFVRNDQPIYKTCYQIALAIKLKYSDQLKAMKFLDWYVKIAIVSAAVGGSMEYFIILDSITAQVLAAKRATGFNYSTIQLQLTFHLYIWQMNVEKLQKMAGAVRTGGKGSVRRKKKAVHKTTTTDDKRLQSTLKRIGVNSIPAIEEVNIFKDETVIQFLNPKVQASIAANTWVVSGSPQTKKLQDILPGILNQLGPDNLDNLRKLAEQFQKQVPGGAEGAAAATSAPEDDDEVPELVAGETFEAAAEEGQKS